MDFTSKIPAFEIIAILIPGAIFFAFVQVFIDFSNCQVLKPVWFSYLIYIFGIYLIGVCLNILSEKLFGARLRNNPASIRAQFEKFNNSKEDGDFYFKNLDTLQNNQEIKHIYLKLYCKLYKNNLLGNIPYIEIQVALLRNMVVSVLFAFVIAVIAVLLYGYGLIVTNANGINLQFSRQWTYDLIITVILAGSFYWMSIVRQDKVYYCVWESMYYFQERELNLLVSQE